MARPGPAKSPPIVVIFGDEEHAKSRRLSELLDAAFPPGTDRSLAVCEYDGTRPADQGGPELAAVLDDLNTVPLLAPRRVVVVRDADGFVSAHRAALERYLAGPSPTGLLVLVCRSFPKTTRLYKRAVACGGQVIECRRLSGRGLLEFVVAEARRHAKRMGPEVAARLIDLCGQDQGVLAGEVEKLCLYVGARNAISEANVVELVGQSRQEKIFAVLDAAAAGRLNRALELWRQTLASDPAAVFRATGGVAYVLRNWLTAHRLVREGLPLRAVANQLRMWGREHELQNLLNRLIPARLMRLLARTAELDAQAKLGTRSIETGIEDLLVELASPTA